MTLDVNKLCERKIAALQIRDVIEKTGLSQRAFAEKIGIPKRTLEDYVNQKHSPSPFTLKMIIEEGKKLIPPEEQ